MLGTAAGRILLAYASPAKQRSLIEYVRVSQSPLRADIGGQFGEIAALIKARGYDIMTTPKGRQTALAVPVLNDQGLAVAALAVRYFNVAMTPDEALRRLMPSLAASADAIGRGLLAWGRTAH
jgi:DNA-binding IclR family transcriptional regulator